MRENSACSASEMLTPKQQKLAMSAQKKSNKKKKKKTTVKPILMNPRVAFKAVKEIADLSAFFLKELQQVVDIDEDKEKLSTTRTSLTLGVNATYRHLSKDNFVGAVLLASDITPVSLVTHLVRRCQHRAIPVSKLSNLRQSTKDVLGFSCICLGLLVKGEVFRETINLIRNQLAEDDEIQTVNEISVNNVSVGKVQVKSSAEVPMRQFQYLKRDSKNVRAFIPESANKTLTKASDSDFISIAAQKFTPDSTVRGISMTLNKTEERAKKRVATECIAGAECGKKKKKKLNGNEQSSSGLKKIAFTPAKVNKFQSNPNRKS